MTPGIKHFLVWRDPDGVRRIDVFRPEQAEHAIAVYDAAENDLMLTEWARGDTRGVEVCLFSTDSLATLCATHASWVAPETLTGDFEKVQTTQKAGADE